MVIKEDFAEDLGTEEVANRREVRTVANGGKVRVVCTARSHALRSTGVD